MQRSSKTKIIGYVENLLLSKNLAITEKFTVFTLTSWVEKLVEYQLDQDKNVDFLLMANFYTL